MSVWVLLLIVCAAGGVGGFVNALMTDNGFVLPKSMQIENGVFILRPGFLGNILIGAIAAGISWGLYGPLGGYRVVGTASALQLNRPDDIALSLSSLVGAVLIGVGGARWLTSEVDKSLLRAAASKAASGNPSPDASKRMALATPIEALAIANSIPK